MENDTPKPSLTLVGEEQPPPRKAPPKRFVRSQIPESILNDPFLYAAINLLPSNYHFEVHKCVWRVRSTHASRVALQLPEGLLMYSLLLSDILSSFAGTSHCFVLAALSLHADLLIHFGHSCLAALHVTCIPCLYVFVKISIDVSRLISTVHLNLQNPKTLVLTGTIQFASYRPRPAVQAPVRWKSPQLHRP